MYNLIWLSQKLQERVGFFFFLRVGIFKKIFRKEQTKPQMG